MEAKEIENIETALDGYFAKKIAINDAVKQLEKEVKEGKRYQWQIDELINALWRETWETEEYKKFIVLHNKANSEPEFEKQFRPIFDKIFVRSRTI